MRAGGLVGGRVGGRPSTRYPLPYPPPAPLPAQYLTSAELVLKSSITTKIAGAQKGPCVCVLCRLRRALR